MGGSCRITPYRPPSRQVPFGFGIVGPLSSTGGLQTTPVKNLLTNAEPIDGHGIGWFVTEAKGMRVYLDAGLRLAILSNGTDLARAAYWT